MRVGAIVLGTFVSVILLALAGVLYILAGADSGQQYRKSIDLVRQIQLLSSDWSVELTRVRSNPFADFDSLAAFVPEIAHLKTQLTGTAQRIPGLPDRLASDIHAYLSALDAKEERIERFKTGYAVVRNSQRYLPLATENVVSQARQRGDAALVNTVSVLARDIGDYLARPTETAQARLTAEIRTLRGASVGYPLALANTLGNLIAHAEVLVVRQRPTQQLFEQATSSDISDLTDQLVRSLEFEAGRTEAADADYELGFLAVIALLILFWVVLALQQRLRGRRAAARPEAIPDPAIPAAAEAAAARPEPQPPRIEPAPLPAAPAARPVRRDTGSALLHGFVVKSISSALAASADEIFGRMDYLRQTQQRLRDALLNSAAAAEMREGAELDEQIESISAIASSVSQKMNGVVDLAKRLESLSDSPADDADRRMIDINACVGHVIEASGAENGATIMKNLGDIPEIFASDAEIEMLLTEIIENSMHAVQGIEDRAPVIKIDTARNNGAIQITVIDNGVGITPENRINIFKPFFTSRDGAVGIGLALAGHLAKKYGGIVKINSLPGQGTVAQITLNAGLSGP